MASSGTWLVQDVGSMKEDRLGLRSVLNTRWLGESPFLMLERISVSWLEWGCVRICRSKAEL